MNFIEQHNGRKMKVIGLSGSIRSNYRHIEKLKEHVLSSNDIRELRDRLKNSDILFSNTDICVAFALLGAKNHGSEIDIFSLTDLFDAHGDDSFYFIDKEYLNGNIDYLDTLNINEIKIQNLLKTIQDADGIVLGTPVYFGDRSSVANKILQLTNANKLLRYKAFGCVSVGAKRNGGQETAIIYSLFEALMQDAVVIGNGPKTCQYGGTVVAGDTHQAWKDDFGIETCVGTGRQVAYLSGLLNYSLPSDTTDRLNLHVLITMDTKDKKYGRILGKYFSRHSQHHQIELVNLTDYKIYRCVGCKVCPSRKLCERNRNKPDAYNCVIQSEDDDFRSVRKKILNSDGIILAGVNTQEDIIYRYQAFMERTRVVRRNDFEFTNIPVFGLLVNEVGSINNPIHNVKVLTSYIRHNLPILKPLQLIHNNGNAVYEDSLDEHLKILQNIKNGRRLISPLPVSYKATGYKDKSLDKSETLRK